MMENGKYQIDIPFMVDPPELPDNRKMAERRLQSLKRRLIQNPDLHEQYSGGMQDLLQKGYAEAVAELEVDAFPGWTW